MTSDPFLAARRSMVEQQLRQRGISDPGVLQALAEVPRELFVPPELRHRAYDDCALPIGLQQTISQPYIVALMTQALELDGRQRVLEIGTGSGYQTAVLSRLAREVFTVERHPGLLSQAAQRLSELGCTNVVFLLGDGSRGHPPQAPYDRILVTAAAPQMPAALWEQLAEGGVIVLPMGPPRNQILCQVRKREGKPYSVELCGCRFVPLVASPNRSDDAAGGDNTARRDDAAHRGDAAETEQAGQ
jgi:protein-L-isoaspartate(D-aspartate) O-methyltransferase